MYNGDQVKNSIPSLFSRINARGTELEGLVNSLENLFKDENIEEKLKKGEVNKEDWNRVLSILVAAANGNCTLEQLFGNAQFAGSLLRVARQIYVAFCPELILAQENF